VFGTAYGGVMPLYVVLAREYFGARIMGTVFGAATMVSSIGMAFGPWAGALIFDSFNSYSWLYIGSFGVGLGAVAVALAFPPLPSRALPAAAGVREVAVHGCHRRARPGDPVGESVDD
jgi:MFS family permease